MKKSERAKLEKQAATLRGRRRSRYIDSREIDTMAALDRKRVFAGMTIRVYSCDGFVPNAYKYPAHIDFVERTYDDEGRKQFAVRQTGASRPQGQGALVTINGRAY